MWSNLVRNASHDYLFGFAFDLQNDFDISNVLRSSCRPSYQVFVIDTDMLHDYRSTFFPPALVDIIAEIYLKSKTNSRCSNGWPINNLSPLRSTQLWERDLRSLQFSWAAPSTEWKCTNSNWLRSLSTTVAVSDLQAPYSTPYNAGIRQTLYLWIPSQRAVLNWQYIVNCHLIELAIFSGRPSSQ